MAIEWMARLRADGLAGFALCSKYSLSEIEAESMKVSASVKRRCPKCRIITRKRRVMVICENPKHKQRQG